MKPTLPVRTTRKVHKILILHKGIKETLRQLSGIKECLFVQKQRVKNQEVENSAILKLETVFQSTLRVLQIINRIYSQI